MYKEFIKLDDTPMVCLKSVLRAILTEKGPFPGGGMGKTFSLLDSNNDFIAQIGLFDDGNPHVGIWDPTKVVNKRAKHGRRVGFSLFGKDEAYFKIQDAEGNTRAVIGTETIEHIILNGKEYFSYIKDR